MSKQVTTIAYQLSAGAKNQLSLLQAKLTMSELENPRLSAQLERNRIVFNKYGTTQRPTFKK